MRNNRLPGVEIKYIKRYVTSTVESAEHEKEPEKHIKKY